MTRFSHLVSAGAGAALAASIILGVGFGPAQGTTGTPPSRPSTPPTGSPAATPPAMPTPPAAPPFKDQAIPAPQDPGKPGVVPMPPEMAAAMEFMQPCPQHEWLAQRVGTWNMTGKMWMSPELPPTPISGTSTFRMILGGRYLVEDVKSTMMGEPFEAMGITAFNRATNRFQYAWLDTMGTAITEGGGTRSADGRTLTGSFTTFDPMAGKDVTMKSVETQVDADTFTHEMSAPGPDGKDMKIMEMTYRRAK